jgi:NAD(P)-dependent dehydrogenase (short-subunit alcohol dehydrogenase family)
LSGLLNGKVIAITGAGRGLGRAYAVDAARAGARIVVNDVRAEFAQAVADEITAEGGHASPHPGSIADYAVAQGMIQRCEDTYGRIDGLVNNAGIMETVNVHDTLWEDVESSTRQIVEVNVLGTLFAGAAAMSRMVAQRSGSIVNIASLAYLGIPGIATYGATKGAVVSATYAWAIMVGEYSVRVNALCPSAHTPGADEITGGRGPEEHDSNEEPEEMAGVVTYLLSDDAAQINGQVVRFNQGKLSFVIPPRYDETVEQADRSAEGFARSFNEILRMRVQPFGVDLKD